MSIVGPRPNLLSQSELIAERTRLGVYSVPPGITGLSQVKGVTMETPNLLAKTDREMIDSLSLSLYFRLILNVFPRVYSQKQRAVEICFSSSKFLPWKNM